jgi:hypothetical protein
MNLNAGVKLSLLPLLVFLISTGFADDKPEPRDWIDVSTGRKITGIITNKKPDNTQVQIRLKGEIKLVWVKTDRLSQEDQALVAEWQNPSAKLTVKSTAFGKEINKWSRTWGVITADVVAAANDSGKQKDQSRIISIEIQNDGTTNEYVVEVYWLAFPLNDKAKRHICGGVADLVQVEPGERGNFAARADHRYRNEKLIFVAVDRSTLNWAGIVGHSWSGSTYAGWAVRVSDGAGNVLDQQGAQPPFLNHIAEIPVPRRQDRAHKAP